VIFLNKNGGEMSILKSTNENKAKGKVKKVFDDIKKNRKISKIPNFWKSLAHNPENLERTWNNLKQIMKKGALDPVTKELIYVAVSITNNCDYCIRSHTAAAKKKGANDEMIKEMIDVVGLANQNNKFVAGYQVEVDKIYK
jgi:AhpD family alkylhydroperoxidase